MYRPTHYSYANKFSVDIEDIHHTFEVYAWSNMRAFSIIYTAVTLDGEVADVQRCTRFFDTVADIPAKLNEWVASHCPQNIAEILRNNLPQEVTV